MPYKHVSKHPWGAITNLISEVCKPFKLVCPNVANRLQQADAGQCSVPHTSIPATTAAEGRAALCKDRAAAHSPPHQPAAQSQPRANRTRQSPPGIQLDIVRRQACPTGNSSPTSCSVKATSESYSAGISRSSQVGNDRPAPRAPPHQPAAQLLSKPHASRIQPPSPPDYHSSVLSLYFIQVNPVQ